MNAIKKLSVNDLSIVFWDKGVEKTVVNDIDFSVSQGEVLGIVGESGSGKTQAALAVLGIQSAWPGIVKGSVKYPDNESELLETPISKSVSNGARWHKDRGRWNRSIQDMYHEIRGKKIFMMFQDPKSYLNPFWNVRHHFERLLVKADRNCDYQRIIGYLHRFGLSESIIDKYPHELSGGMNQRLMIALGAACEPEILIADEITTGLDLVNQLLVVKHIREVKAEGKQAIIMISHDLGFISKLADKILVVYAGQGMEYGPADTVLDDLCERHHPYTKLLLEIYRKNDKIAFLDGPPPDRYLGMKSGCRFYTRCPVYNERPDLNCNNISPKDYDSSQGDYHYIRCLLEGWDND
jgi:oligopeptide transport system ATP-binding protein